MGRGERAVLGVSSVGCLFWSAICFRFYQISRRDIEALSSAVDITPSALPNLPQQLESAPNRRLLIKVSGFLIAPKPITAPEAPTVPAVLVRKKSTSWATNRSSQVVDLHKSQADEIEIKLKGGEAESSYTEGPALHLSPSLLDHIPGTTVSYKQTFHGNRFFSAIMSIGFFNFTWRMTDHVEVVPQGKRIFAAVDAVADTNGRITLIDSNRISERRIISYKHYAQVMDEKKDQATVWKGFSIASAFVGAILAGVAAISD